MITLKRIYADDELFSWAMNLLAVSFPASERRDDDFQRKTMIHSDYRLCAIMNGNMPVGVVGYFDSDSFIYFENFCVEPEKRNNGFGSQTLQFLTACGKPFILEIEPPVDELTQRRLQFYERNGMIVNPYPHIQPHYRADDDDLPLVVLSYGKQLTQEQYNEFRVYLDNNVDIKAWLGK